MNTFLPILSTLFLLACIEQPELASERKPSSESKGKKQVFTTSGGTVEFSYEGDGNENVQVEIQDAEPLETLPEGAQYLQGFAVVAKDENGAKLDLDELRNAYLLSMYVNADSKTTNRIVILATGLSDSQQKQVILNRDLDLAMQGDAEQSESPGLTLTKADNKGKLKVSWKSKKAQATFSAALLVNGNQVPPGYVDYSQANTVKPVAEKEILFTRASESEYTNTSDILLLTYAPNATHIYVTENPNCSDGGQWQELESSLVWQTTKQNTKVTIYAKFRNDASESQCFSSYVYHDNLPPNTGVITFNHPIEDMTNLKAITVLLNHKDAELMMIGEDQNCAKGNWYPFKGSHSHTLSKTNQNMTIGIQFADAAGNISPCQDFSFVHDDLAPPAPALFDDGILTYAATQSPTITWSAVQDTGVGFSHYLLALGTEPNKTDIAPWTNVGQVTTYMFTDLNLQYDQTYFASIKAVDRLGNAAIKEGNGFSVTNPEIGWNLSKFIKGSNSDNGDMFGYTVALDGDYIVVGAPFEDANVNTISGTPSTNNSLEDAGAAYVYKRQGETWQLDAYLKSSSPCFKCSFGKIVAIAGNTIAVAQTRDFYPTDDSVYVYERNSSGIWQEKSVLQPRSASSVLFARALAITEDFILIGDPAHENPITNEQYMGVVEVYKKDQVNNTWNFLQTLQSWYANNISQYSFGSSISISNNTLVVGAPMDGTKLFEYGLQNGSAVSGTTWSWTQDMGSAWVFTFDAQLDQFVPQAYLRLAQEAEDAQFGSSVAVEGDIIAVAGRETLHTYKRTGIFWQFQSEVSPHFPTAGDGFHCTNAFMWDISSGRPCLAIALVNNQLIVGERDNRQASNQIADSDTGISTNTDAPLSGATYVFELEDNAWTQSLFIKAPNNATNQEFGGAIAASMDYLIIGSALDASAMTDPANTGYIVNATSAPQNSFINDSGSITVLNWEQKN